MTVRRATLRAALSVLWPGASLLILLVGCGPAPTDAPQHAGNGQPREEESTPEAVDRSPRQGSLSSVRILMQMLDETPNVMFRVEGLPESVVEGLAAAELSDDDYARFFSIRIARSSGESQSAESPPPLIGTYGASGGRLRFTPRFGLQPGLAYEAVFDASRLPERIRPEDVAASSGPVTARFEIPKKEVAASTVVSEVYPTTDVLPENQLKFYLYFSAPMSRGLAYKHVRLLTEKGEPIEDPFLELGEELWDRTGTRFTLFFDPGRIKRGLKPREEVGPALEEGKAYVLVVSREWLDAEGNPLVADFRKEFKVAGPDDGPPSEKEWRIEPPAPGEKSPLVVTFPEPLDRAMLDRVVWVTDSAGEQVAGKVQIDKQETRWQLTPEKPWQPGTYKLVAETTLEDRAGNSLGRPFEIDQFNKVEIRTSQETVSLEFEIPQRR